MISEGHTHTYHVPHLTNPLATIIPFWIILSALRPQQTNYFAMPAPAKAVFKKNMQSDYPWCLPSCAIVLTPQRRLGKNYTNESSSLLHNNRSLLPILRFCYSNESDIRMFLFPEPNCFLVDN